MTKEGGVNSGPGCGVCGVPDTQEIGIPGGSVWRCPAHRLERPYQAEARLAQYVDSGRSADEKEGGMSKDSPEKRGKMTVAEVAALGDVVIVLREGGSSGLAYVRGVRAPYVVDVHYGEKDDPPLTIRQATIKVGWPLKDWRKADAEARKVIGEGPPWWQKRQGSDVSPLPANGTARRSG